MRLNGDCLMPNGHLATPPDAVEFAAFSNNPIKNHYCLFGKVSFYVVQRKWDGEMAVCLPWMILRGQAGKFPLLHAEGFVACWTTINIPHRGNR
jgi:hypothetical protein